MSGAPHRQWLDCAVVTADAFRPFGDLIEPEQDGRPFGGASARLDLTAGQPRFYIMSLEARGLGFTAITRHCRVTQCLAALGGHDWYIAVAPPDGPHDPDAQPDPDAIRAFKIPGTVAIKLHRGTWHAGPYFTAPRMDFLNLELTDTNETDHDTCHLDRVFGRAFEIGP